MKTCLTQRRNGANKGNDEARMTNDECRNRISFVIRHSSFVILSLCVSMVSTHAEQAAIPNFAEPADESAQYTVETLATGLNHPCGLAVRPSAPEAGPFELFFSESGAGRVVRISTDKPSEVTPIVTDFPIAALDDATLAERAGPLALAFLTKSKLAVGAGGLPLGEDQIRVYALPDDAMPLKYDQADHSVGPVPAGDRTKTGEGDFFALARIDEDVEKALYAVSAGDAEQGWLLKAAAAGNKLADLQPFIATTKITGAGRPLAVTVNPRPRSHYLLVGQAGETGDERDSVIGFYGPATGTPALMFKAGLYDVAGLAYSSNGDLYAVDLGLHNKQVGGVYRIDAAEVDGRESCRPVKIAAVERPTSLAFTPDGSLYVTAFGNRTDSDSPTGVLLKVTPGPSTPKL
jgi:hypothetical protein